MKDQKRFTELLRDFRSNVLLFESTLLKLESLERAWEEGSLSERYSEETVKQAISDLYDEVSWIGRDVSNLALWINNACAFSAAGQGISLSP
ncbi:hypothetical protein [Neglectibacter caecimuris]|uniref:hypothetical protein n=1 Tax=Neglectibacter caecimuris TaxID=3093658 RepID=UPI002AC8DC8F|nr:hypothetical protein [Neglectibacter sp. M00184]